jgi:uncharacterized membrane protein
MISHTSSKQISFDISLVCFAALACAVNLVALAPASSSPLMYVAQFFSFIYIIVTPGLFLLPFLTRKKLPFALGIAFSVALSIFSLMGIGLVLNTFLPMFGISAPLTTVPLLLAFDVYIFALFLLNDAYETSSVLQPLQVDLADKTIVSLSVFLPVLACIGTVSLNNGGTNIISMMCLGLIAVLVGILALRKQKSDDSVLPIALYMMALTLLLMNSMRGWFVTGHDILLEYHVFTLTNTMHLWNIAIFRDPYNSCLSLTILPTYFDQLMHASSAYIFKFFMQFIGALPVVVLYYMAKRYTSDVLAFLAGFLYISFPTFMVDMAFLNRQGIAFLFFALLLVVLLSTEYFSGWTRTCVLFLCGTGIILSHYSTSYVAIALLIIAYVTDKVLRFVFKNRKIYQGPPLLGWTLVVGLLIILVVWSGVITKTSTSVVTTIQQIASTVEHPFVPNATTSADGGPAQYSLIQSSQPTPTQMFNQFATQTIHDVRVPDSQSNFYPLSLANQYPAFPVAPVNEPPIPITRIGQEIQASLHTSLATVYAKIKQSYAAIMQVLLILGVWGLLFGYGFRKHLFTHVPSIYCALSIAGIAVLVGQTVLPASAIDYGLLRLFQQNLILLALPISLISVTVISFFVRADRLQIGIYALLLIVFFLVLSGFIPQVTGGGRPPLPLDNYGFYYDAYYTHAEEVSAIDWLAAHNAKSPIQSDHYFSSVKILAYGNEGAITGLLSQTIQKDSYVYLNYNNVKTSTVIEFINSNVFYYHLSTQFLHTEKNLIYNDGGSEIYK